jgi:4,5-DOPA dioxygenase extradiol
MNSTLMPVVFYGHGSPMNALGGPHIAAWRALGETLPHPDAILMISAHWETDGGTAVTAMERPKTIHDFGGFPQALFDMQYPAQGRPELARRVLDLIGEAHPDQSWGLDHGTWSMLVHTYPDADIPVVQLRLDRGLTPRQHYELARRLAPLRGEGVLIAGSGDIVHNLRAMRRDGSTEPFDWALRFDTAVKDALRDGDHDRLIALADPGGLGGEDARLAADDHFLPILYVAAQQRPGEPVRFFNEAIEMGSVSMTGVVIGA